MLHALITGKTRIKLLLRFFLNPDTTSYIRELASEFNESTNSIKIELHRFSNAGLLNEDRRDGKVFFSANKSHSLFWEIHSIAQKTLGIDILVEQLIKKIGALKRAYLVGDYAKGVDGGLIDLVLIGRDIDVSFLQGLVYKVEGIIERKIRYLILRDQEEKKLMDRFDNHTMLLLWNEEEGTISTKQPIDPL